MKEFENANYETITRNLTKYIDGLIVSSEDLNPEVRKVFDEATCEKLDFVAEEHQVKEISEFLDKIIETEVLT